jgi:hypothetical protein
MVPPNKEACSRVSASRRGTGHSGRITLDRPGQAILERSSVVIGGVFIEVRCFIGLPANGRKINSPLAADMIFNELPQIVNRSLLDANTDHQALQRHIAALPWPWWPDSSAGTESPHPLWDWPN